MPDVREYQSVMEEAEQAARAGDFARANTRLRDALALQEASLGAAHPDLASTLNNLAVVCETLGDVADAERFYRRAYAIASGSLPPDDPLVVTSRENLKDFCAARGLPLDLTGGGVAGDAVRAAEASLPARAVAAPPVPAPPRRDPPSPVAPPPRTVPAASAPASPSADAPARPWSLRVIALVAALALVGAVVFFRSGPATEPDAAPQAPAASPEPAPPAPTASSAVPSAAPPPSDRSTPPAEPSPAPAAPAAAAPAPARDAPPPSAAERAPASAGASGIRIVTANVCASLTTSGAWRCDAVGAATPPGRAAFYTRLASPRPIRVEHRWYQGDRLRQNVTLSIGANASAGYRTFSRQTLTPGAWRVELRAADGQVLYETAFDVR